MRDNTEKRLRLVLHIPFGFWCPAGFYLVPMLFSIYMKLLGEVIERELGLHVTSMQMTPTSIILLHLGFVKQWKHQTSISNKRCWPQHRFNLRRGLVEMKVLGVHEISEPILNGAVLPVRTEDHTLGIRLNPNFWGWTGSALLSIS